MLFSIALISVVTLHVNDITQLVGVKLRHFWHRKIHHLYSLHYARLMNETTMTTPFKTFTMFIEKQNYGPNVLLKPRALLHGKANKLTLLFCKHRAICTSPCVKHGRNVVSVHPHKNTTLEIRNQK